MITDEGFEVWYALWEDVIASDRESALVFVADSLRRAGRQQEYLDYLESS